MQYLEKVKRRVRGQFLSMFKNKSFYFYLYPSFWHKMIFHQQVNEQSFLTIIPNRGAGIGHQLANWNAGLFYAGYFGLDYASSGFTNKWTEVLGIDHSLKSASQLLENGYRKVQLPYFKEDNPKQVSIIKEIIASYGHRKILFYLEYDQPYRKQIGVINSLKKFYYTSPARKNDHLLFNSNELNICVHVRRGDIVQQGPELSENLQMRFQTNGYFKNVVDRIVGAIPSGLPYKIFIFSQGNEIDYPEFIEMENVVFCLQMDAYASFIHFVNADILVTSKSSFSYKPTLISDGIKICPKNFWHDYPNSEDFILAEDDGFFPEQELAKQLNSKIQSLDQLTSNSDVFS